MTNYYKMQMIAYDAIDKRIATDIGNRGFCEINQLVLDITKSHPISPKNVIKRAELWVAVNTDNFQLKNGEIRTWE